MEIQMGEKLVNFHLDEDLYKKLKLLSARENKPIKDILKEEIEKYCKVHEEGNPQHLITSSIENEDFIGFPSIATDYQKKQEYIKNHCVDDDRLNSFGNQLWSHVTQWYHLMEKL